MTSVCRAVEARQRVCRTDLPAADVEADPELVAQYNYDTATVDPIVSYNSQPGNLGQYKIHIIKTKQKNTTNLTINLIVKKSI